MRQAMTPRPQQKPRAIAGLSSGDVSPIAAGPFGADRLPGAARACGSNRLSGADRPCGSNRLSGFDRLGGTARFLATVGAVLLAVALWAAPLAAQDADTAGRRVDVGTVVYVEGAPEVFRDGELMPNPADFGFPVESFDFFRTAAGDLLEIATNPDLGAEARIIVQPDTELYLDMSVLRVQASATAPRNTVELIHGSISVVVDRLGRESSFEVATESATLGVRGTTFSVDATFNGDVLVTAEEGRVEVRDEGGRTLFADPERAVERLGPDRFRNIALDTTAPDRDDIQSFRRRWIADRLQELRRNPAAVLRVQARRYLEAREDLTRVYQALMARRDVLDRWIDEERRLLQPDEAALPQQLRRVAPALRRALPVLQRYERLHYRLRHTAEIYRSEGLDPELRVTDDLTAEELFSLIEGDVAVFERRMNIMRYVTKLYLRRNEGALPEAEEPAAPEEDGAGAADD